MRGGGSWGWRAAAGDMGNEEDDYPQTRRQRCYCGAFLSKEPNEIDMVMDQILTWSEPEFRADGTLLESYPLECTWTEEPYWKCKRCGQTLDYDDMYY